MANYSISNLATIYKAVINGQPQFHNPTRDVCFGSSLSKMNIVGNNTCSYEIVLITTDDYAARQNGRNECFMSKHELENYLRRIASIKQFKYVVRTTTWCNYPCYKINLNITGTKKEITFVLQCIKRTYEYPYNFYLLEAYRMQACPAFKFDSILNLYNCTASLFMRNRYTDHSFSINAKFEKYKTLRERLPEIRMVSDLYPVAGSTNYTTIDLYNAHLCESNNWTQASFESRLPKYIERYHELKR